MTFQYQSQADSDVFMSLAGAVKNNNGFFKSGKQARFIAKNYSFLRWSPENSKILTQNDCDRAKDFFNVIAEPGQSIYQVSATVRWADYGRKSYRRVEWMFVCDDYGVVRKYKLAFSYDDAHGSSGVNKNKTALEFERDPSIALPAFEAEPIKPAGEFVGVIGERSVFEAKVVRVINLGPSRFCYNGTSYLSILIDANGNCLKYFNIIAAEGETVKFKATVKDHQVYEGKKSTLIQRASILKEKAPK